MNGGALGSYGYDGNGKRVKKTESGVTTYYVISSVLGSVLEVTSSGLHHAYVMSGISVVAQLNPNGSFYWLHQDHLGSGRKMTDSTGAMVYRAEFDPYGKLLYEWSSPSNLNSRKFTGYERDAATNLDYAQARMYSSDWGRFMSPDPAGMSSVSLTRPKSLNRYAYVEGNPVNAIDPAGANLWGWLQGFFGGVFGGNGAGTGFLANDDNYWNWFYWQLPQWMDAPYLPNPEPTEPEPVVETCTITLIARSPAGIAGWILMSGHIV